ncbi:MAG: rhombosortase, partial [Burkholderiaceae bacterium]
ALGLGALALWGAPREALDWQPGLVASQPWRLWTAGLVHLTPGHLMANLAGCAVVGAFGMAARASVASVVAWAMAWPMGHAALLALPQLQHYAGLSGVLHAGVVVAALPLLWRGTGRRRWIGAAVLAGLALKLFLERAWSSPVQQVPGWDFPIAGAAHLSGALAGLVCGALALCCSARAGDHVSAGASGGTGPSVRKSSLR